MARPESAGGGDDHDRFGAHRGEAVPGEERAAGRGAQSGAAPGADVRTLAGGRRPRRADQGAGGMGRGPLRLLLDSVILIDHFNGRAEATRYLARVAGESAISVITRAEVLAGFDPVGTALAVRLLDRFPTLNID